MPYTAPFIPRGILQPDITPKQLTLALRDGVAAFAAYKEKTSDPTPLFNAQTFARVPLAPDEETRYGLRIKGVMVELDDAVAFQRIARPTKGLPRRRQAQGRAQPGAQKVAAETQGEDVVMGDAVAEQSTTEARQAGDDVLGKGMRRWLAS